LHGLCWFCISQSTLLWHEEAWPPWTQTVSQPWPPGDSGLSGQAFPKWSQHQNFLCMLHPVCQFAQPALQSKFAEAPLSTQPLPNFSQHQAFLERGLPIREARLAIVLSVAERVRGARACDAGLQTAICDSPRAPILRVGDGDLTVAAEGPGRGRRRRSDRHRTYHRTGDGHVGEIRVATLVLITAAPILLLLRPATVRVLQVSITVELMRRLVAEHEPKKEHRRYGHGQHDARAHATLPQPPPRRWM